MEGGFYPRTSLDVFTWSDKQKYIFNADQLLNRAFEAANTILSVASFQAVTQIRWN